jgi:hypothetical protein
MKNESAEYAKMLKKAEKARMVKERIDSSRPGKIKLWGDQISKKRVTFEISVLGCNFCFIRVAWLKFLLKMHLNVLYNIIICIIVGKS